LKIKFNFIFYPVFLNLIRGFSSSKRSSQYDTAGSQIDAKANRKLNKKGGFTQANVGINFAIPKKKAMEE